MPPDAEHVKKLRLEKGDMDKGRKRQVVDQMIWVGGIVKECEDSLSTSVQLFYA
jgi:hypothetical protein